MPFGLFVIMTEAPARGTWETKLGKIQDRLDDQGTVAAWQTERVRQVDEHASLQSLVRHWRSHHAKPDWAVVDGVPTVPSEQGLHVSDNGPRPPRERP